MAEKILREKGLVVRHSFLELLEHWVVALSGIVLIFSGLFQMPIANRYYVTSVPGLAWSGDFIVSLNVHYVASAFFIAAALFHVIYHGILGEKGMIPQRGDLKTSVTVIKSFFGKGEEPPFHKYLPEQRLAYIAMAFIIAILILSGLVMTYKNIFAPDMSPRLVFIATWAHIIFFILFVLAFLGHIAAIILKPNRPMVRSIFTGAVRLDYARHRHPLWMAELEGGPEMTEPVEQITEEAPEETKQPENIKSIDESEEVEIESKSAPLSSEMAETFQNAEKKAEVTDTIKKADAEGTNKKSD